ncbi:hypothetical protein [Caballeronia sp. J97]|uniref:hypothetical protein n=1 Tax=Caballeronia sp. J97 TaxID=2805429 RepID=UPI002AB19419|nr:hypothetical protein [Caballeronia sp. J97]
MNVLFPQADSVYVGEGPIYFDAIVDGVTVNCVLTEHALAAAAGIDQVMSRREAFAFGQPAIKEVVARRARHAALGPIVITRAELDYRGGHDGGAQRTATGVRCSVPR